MADIISRLKLESGEFDSKIKRAGQELMAYSEHCRKTGLQMGFANKDARDFAQSLGNMQTTSTTARGKINELSDAFVNLRVMYKNMTDEEKNNQFGKNLAASLDQLKTRIMDAKKDLADVTAELNGTSSGGKGGFLSGSGMSGMFQVFGGNLMTKGAGMLANFASEMGDMVQQGIQMAQQGEGIRIAFERLNRPDILDNLREATHGTVTDLELMKQAVKFNDFKLPLDQMGTLLAFAQQKAKDTGQSVDYMVDSIVTGLGRQSLMILDNLGLSASQIKERMAETGDMTTAVADIIREQMSAAGDYVETAADRATQADVELKNAMEELGRTLLPLQQEGASVFTGIETAAISALNSGIAPLIPKIVELKNGISELYISVSESSVFKGLVNWMEAGIDATIRWIPLLNTLRGLMQENAAGAGASVGGAIAAGIPDAQEVKNIGEVVVTGNAPKGTTRRTGGSRTPKQSIDDTLLSSFNKADLGINPDSLRDTSTGPSKLWEMMRQEHYDNLKPEQRMSRADFEEGQSRAREHIENTEDPFKYEKKQLAKMDAIAGNIGNITSGLAKMGIELPEGITEMVEGIQTVISIISSIMTLVTLISSIQSVKSIPIIGWALANGGIAGGLGGRRLIHAAGGTVVGNTYSGDQIPAMLNAGEVVLSKAQAGVIASDLQGGGMQNMNLQAVVTGEQLRFILNTNSRRRGKGEYVTSTHQ